ncbi:hypothetical protein G5714_024634 [Onychostoma macrolepis]|uniref:Uncharacterized protein n=1 Tax=Onychostoma macrolepis TaxID=369639 RepID=A0A7J6BLT5_9TELE|nr:hypothetical protein G5714_024634 [Onychostoma macrolepis]
MLFRNPLHRTNTPLDLFAGVGQWHAVIDSGDVLEIHWGLEILHAEEKRLCLFFFTSLACFFATLSASDKHAAGPFSSRGTVAHLDRIVVSTLPCGRSNPGHGSLLLSSNGDVGLLFASSSFSWILSSVLSSVASCAALLQPRELEGRS